jgi:hypothetical protein
MFGLPGWPGPGAHGAEHGTPKGLPARVFHGLVSIEMLPNFEPSAEVAIAPHRCLQKTQRHEPVSASMSASIC